MVFGLVRCNPNLSEAQPGFCAVVPIGFFYDDDYSSPGEINLLQRDVVSRLPAEA